MRDALRRLSGFTRKLRRRPGSPGEPGACGRGRSLLLRGPARKYRVHAGHSSRHVRLRLSIEDHSGRLLMAVLAVVLAGIVAGGPLAAAARGCSASILYIDIGSAWSLDYLLPFGPRGSTVSGKQITYWITSSARPSSDGGIVRPRALAVLRLIISVKVVGCPMGKSSGLTPFRMRSTYVAACRYMSSVFAL